MTGRNVVVITDDDIDAPLVPGPGVATPSDDPSPYADQNVDAAIATATAEPAQAFDVPAAKPAGAWRRLSARDGTRGGEPFYPRLLGLKHIYPNAWQRAALVEGLAVVGALAALADRATAWAPLLLPVAGGAVVKFHDVLTGLLPGRAARVPENEPDASAAERMPRGEPSNVG